MSLRLLIVIGLLSALIAAEHVVYPAAAEGRGCSAATETWMGLRVCEESRTRIGYDRRAFGSAYKSKEDDIISRLPNAGGYVRTPYTCAAYSILRNGTAATDIEHVVSLAEAHDSGIDPSRRRTFSGDLDNLTIAAPAVNRFQKSDRDAGEWVPLRNRAWFALTVIQVKRKYGLSVDPAERDSLAGLLSKGPDAPWCEGE